MNLSLSTHQILSCSAVEASTLIFKSRIKWHFTSKYLMDRMKLFGNVGGMSLTSYEMSVLLANFHKKYQFPTSTIEEPEYEGGEYHGKTLRKNWACFIFNKNFDLFVAKQVNGTKNYKLQSIYFCLQAPCFLCMSPTSQKCLSCQCFNQHITSNHF